MPSYLVTGGCGFIGAHLCRSLLADGNQVRVIDDLSTGRRDNLPDGVEFFEGDISDQYCLDAGLAGIDGCFHLAAVASVARGVADWLGTHRVNLRGAIVLFDAIARLPGGRRPPRRPKSGRFRPMAPTNTRPNCMPAWRRTCMASRRSGCASSMSTARGRTRRHPIRG
jgi:NAD(P)-dependent dehydrogenase (short-subunit alcohol dehydrogenase family)